MGVNMKENNMIQNNKKYQVDLAFWARVKRLFRSKPKRKKNDDYLGKHAGFLWAHRVSNTLPTTVYVVQVEEENGSAIVTICDSNDEYGCFLMNNIEFVITGVYLDCLSSKYFPDEVKFFHRRTLTSGSEPEWGSSPVNLKWLKTEQRFDFPEWGQWKPDVIVSENDKAFVRNLRNKAAIEVERIMRERHESGKVTKREDELYGRYQEHISGKSERYRYNLRGNWVLAPTKLNHVQDVQSEHSQNEHAQDKGAECEHAQNEQSF